MRTVVFVCTFAVADAVTGGATARVIPCGHWSGGNASSGWAISSTHDVLAISNAGRCLDAVQGHVLMSECDKEARTQQWRNLAGLSDIKVDKPPAACSEGCWQLQNLADGRCLMVATTSYSLSSVVASIFTSLGTEEQLAKEEFLKLFGFLAEADKSLPEHSVDTLAEELAHLEDADFISFSVVSETPFMKEVLALA